MPLDFPSGPAINDTWTGSNGVSYTWNGTMWVVSGSGTGPYLLLAGGTMTGPIALAADPTTDPQAANKHYVDASINLAGNYLGTWAVASNTPNISAGGSISNANYVATTVVAGTPETVPVGVPGIAGMSVANGDRIIWASGLGVWQILRNAGVTLAAADARYYAITNPSGYQTAANVTTALAPYAPLAAPVFTGDARAVTPTVGDNDTSIATTAFVQSAVAPDRNNVGRNLLHNALFNVAQRGSGPFTAAGYGLDRWKIYSSLDTVSHSQQPFGAPGVPGIDEAASRYWSNTFTGNAGAGAINIGYQLIEGMKRLSGKTVTVSFNASNNAGALKLGVSLDQNFGTGGSPSAPVNGNGQSVTLSTTWTRYVLTFAVPSVASMTIGTNGDDSTGLNFWYSAGSSFNTRSGNVGVQSGTINIWGVQLEIGSVATLLEKTDPQQELAKCQRFYHSQPASLIAHANAGGFVAQTITFPTAMRAAPTIAIGATIGTDSNVASVSADTVQPTSLRFVLTAAGATGIVSGARYFTASADL